MIWNRYWFVRTHSANTPLEREPGEDLLPVLIAVVVAALILVRYCGQVGF